MQDPTNIPARVPILKDTLQRVAQFATKLEPTGISLRFLNYPYDQRGGFDNLGAVSEIMDKTERVYEVQGGGTQLGTMLNTKVVQPMIINKVNSGNFRKPIIVILITDGEVSTRAIFKSPDRFYREEHSYFKHDRLQTRMKEN